MKTTARRLLLLAPALLLTGCGQTALESPSEVIAVYRDTLPVSLDDPLWDEAPVHVAPLLLQDLVEPRQLQATTASVRVRAVTDGRNLAFRIAWRDPSVDNRPGASRFSDAVAVQLPARPGADVPAPQMGEPGKPVEITYWSAAFQAVVDGRGDTIKDLYPGATVDHYPFEAASLEDGSRTQQSMADLYSPARSLGNSMGGPRTSAVQDLVAEGPGTLAPAARSVSEGSGRHGDDGWAVSVRRPMPSGWPAGLRTQVAFAVWDGANQEVGARKMRSIWIPFNVEAQR